MNFSKPCYRKVIQITFMFHYPVQIGMTGYEVSRLSARHRDDIAAPLPRTVVGSALFMLFPVAIGLAVAFPVTAGATVGGAVFAKLHRRWRAAHRRAETNTAGLSRKVTHDV